MSRYYSNTAINSEGPGRPKKKNGWIIALKAVCWCVGILVVLAAIALWIFSYYVSPERITKLIEKESAEYLDGEIKIGKLDYKFFKTYPWLSFELDSLTVISHSLDKLPENIKDSLPKNFNRLAFVEKLHGKINVKDLVKEKITIKDIEIVKPAVNIVMVDDTTANFNIAPNMPSVKKVPELDISEVNVAAPVSFSFFSLAPDTEAELKVNDFYLLKETDSFYKIGFAGDLDGRYGEYMLPGKLPVRFETKILPDFPNITMQLDSLSMSLAGISLLANGELKASQKGIDLKKADLKIRIEDLFRIEESLPQQIAEMIALPEGLTGNLPLDLQLSLLAPYKIDSNTDLSSTENLPPMEAVVTIDEANIKMRPPKGKPVEADDIYFEAMLHFTPDDSSATSLTVNELRMHGEGISLRGEAEISNLLGDTQEFEGKFNFGSPVMETLSYFMPNLGFKISGYLKGNVELSGETLGLGKDGLKDLAMKGEISSHTMKVNSGSALSLALQNMKGDFEAHLPAYPVKDYSGTRLGFILKSDSINCKASGSDISMTGLDLELDARDTVSGNPDPFGNIAVKMQSLKASDNGTSLKAENIHLNAKGTLNSNPQGNYPTVSPTTGGNDALIASRVKHTPLVVEYEGGGLLQTIMSMMTLESDIQIGNGEFSTPAYLYPVVFDNLDLNTNLNRFRFSASQVGIGRTGMSLSGEVTGLKGFLTSYSATPLKASADINFSDVDINQLSWGYYGTLVARGKDSVFYVPPTLPYTADDSTCVAIPRNIEADIRLHSRRAEYMQYQFSPLSTEIIVKDGNATLKELTVGAPYCTAIVDWTYSTGNLDNIYMDLKARVKDFSFEPFYMVFPSLVEKTPELKNFTGVINADVSCRFGMWPDMFMNSESLKALFAIKGSEMEFARQGKIEKITHLMRIPGDEPIKIQNMTITGDFHDNLLQLNPFTVSFDDYRLQFAGINNTSGDMYYHIALKESPFHLPFGVSLIGKFSHPEIRVGGTHIDDYRSEMVGMEPSKKLNVNIMAYLKNGWQLFIQEAAKYEGKLNEKE